MTAEVEVPFGDSASDTATLLLAAVEELDREPSEVRTTSGAFLVPQDIADQAGVEYQNDETEQESDPDPAPARRGRRRTTTPEAPGQEE